MPALRSASAHGISRFPPSRRSWSRACRSEFYSFVTYYTRIAKRCRPSARTRPRAHWSDQCELHASHDLRTARRSAGVAGTVSQRADVYVPAVGVPLVLKASRSSFSAASAAFWHGRRQSRARPLGILCRHFIQDGSGWAEGVTFLLINVLCCSCARQGMFGVRDHG